MGFFLYCKRNSTGFISDKEKIYSFAIRTGFNSFTLWMLSIPSPIASLQNLYHTHAGVEGI
jgi:hypothetical protein